MPRIAAWPSSVSPFRRRRRRRQVRRLRQAAASRYAPIRNIAEFGHAAAAGTAAAFGDAETVPVRESAARAFSTGTRSTGIRMPSRLPAPSATSCRSRIARRPARDRDAQPYQGYPLLLKRPDQADFIPYGKPADLPAGPLTAWTDDPSNFARIYLAGYGTISGAPWIMLARVEAGGASTILQVAPARDFPASACWASRRRKPPLRRPPWSRRSTRRPASSRARPGARRRRSAPRARRRRSAGVRAPTGSCSPAADGPWSSAAIRACSIGRARGRAKEAIRRRLLSPSPPPALPAGRSYAAFANAALTADGFALDDEIAGWRLLKALPRSGPGGRGRQGQALRRGRPRPRLARSPFRGRSASSKAPRSRRPHQPRPAEGRRPRPPKAHS